MGLGGGEDEKNVYGKPFEDIEDFYEKCPLHTMPYVINSFDCDDFIGWATACAITMGYNVCAVLTPGVHINSIIEVESGIDDKNMFCVINPQTQNRVVTSPGCPTGCWLQDKDEKEPLKSKAGSCVGPNQEIWCNFQRIINFTRDPYTSFCDEHYCNALNEKGVCVDEILEHIKKRWPSWDPSTGHTYPGGGPQPRRPGGIFRRRRGR